MFRVSDNFDDEVQEELKQFQEQKDVGKEILKKLVSQNMVKKIILVTETIRRVKEEEEEESKKFSFHPKVDCRVPLFQLACEELRRQGFDFSSLENSLQEKSSQALRKRAIFDLSTNNIYSKKYLPRIAEYPKEIEGDGEFAEYLSFDNKWNFLPENASNLSKNAIWLYRTFQPCSVDSVRKL